MTNKTPEGGSVAEGIAYRFDTILSGHIQRLLGARHGIGGLPVTTNAVSCILLFAEQVKNEQGDPAGSEPYNRERLHTELTEMCLDADTIMDMIIPDLARRGYIRTTADSGIFILDHTVRMARILDHIFPTMPGINLVAYLAQAMDEVKSGRKSLETAANHFDQTLTIHGVALKKKQGPADGGRSLNREDIASLIQKQNRRPVRSKIIKGSDFEAAQKKRAAGGGKAPVPETVPPPEVTSPDPQGTVAATPVPELLAGSARATSVPENRLVEPDREHHKVDLINTPPGETPEAGEHAPSFSTVFSNTSSLREGQAPLVAPLHDLIMSGDMNPSSRSTSEIDPVISSSTGAGGIDEEKGGNDPSGSTAGEKFRDETDEVAGNISPDPVVSPGDDNIVEKRIADFAEDLAMQCPICRTGRIVSHQTITGKCYYACSDRNCTFISWGKPHHLTCPACGNPFLIESPGQDGESILTCPRATCFHRQSHPSDASGDATQTKNPPASSTTSKPPSRKKLVRRKVVRRKR